LVSNAVAPEESEAESSPRVEMVHAMAGVTLDLGGGGRLEVVDPAYSRTTLRITFGSASVILTECDVATLGRTGLASGPSAVVLLGEGRQVARSLGEAWSSPGPLILVAAPLPGDPFPTDAARTSALPVVATPIQGWIRLTTDGTRLWVEAERTP
jgi:hypothetical protein